MSLDADTGPPPTTPASATTGPTGRAEARAGIRRLRAQLASLVHRAEVGERTVVTVDGRPVAQLTSLGHPGGGLDDLMATGALLGPRDGGRPRWPAGRRLVTDMTTDSALGLVRGTS